MTLVTKAPQIIPIALAVPIRIPLLPHPTASAATAAAVPVHMMSNVNGAFTPTNTGNAEATSPVANTRKSRDEIAAGLERAATAGVVFFGRERQTSPDTPQ